MEGQPHESRGCQFIINEMLSLSLNHTTTMNRANLNILNNADWYTQGPGVT